MAMPDDNEGDVGYLTWPQFNAFRWARNHADNLVPWLRVAGYIRSADADVRVKTSSNGHIGLPPTWISADTITRLLIEIGSWRDSETTVNDTWGAELALTLTREVQTADARWPYEDTPHYVLHMRCPACHHLSLRYTPPADAGERVEVKCMLCAHAMDEDGFSVAALLIEEENATRGLGNDGAGAREGAEVA